MLFYVSKKKKTCLKSAKANTTTISHLSILDLTKPNFPTICLFVARLFKMKQNKPKQTLTLQTPISYWN